MNFFYIISSDLPSKVTNEHFLLKYINPRFPIPYNIHGI